MPPPSGGVSPREWRIGRRLEARGERPLFDALLRLRGVAAGGFRLESLYAVGGEGAIFLARDAGDPGAPPCVAKVALAPWHRPIHLTSKLLRRHRGVVEEEAKLLAGCGSPFLPRPLGLAAFVNPLLEAARGGEFARPEPCLVMEKLSGHDLDVWLCRVHRGAVDKAALRRTLDRIAVGVLQALADLEQRGFLYADLRPGNVRVVGRPERRVRLLDAGGCVRADGSAGRFPHVPSYLPPDVFRGHGEGQGLVPSKAIHAVMAGRTLFEVATGQAPKAGRHIDVVRLLRSPISAPVAEVVAALANGAYPHCGAALQTLVARARRRVSASPAPRAAPR